MEKLIIADNNCMSTQFNNIKIDPSWSFSEKTRKDTTYATHGYHRYPAKFIPQLSNRLIDRYTKPGDLVADIFCGCGTTLVEAKIMGRKTAGTDINPVAVLIAKSKLYAFEPKFINDKFNELMIKLNEYNPESSQINVRSHERIDYWFKPKEKQELSFILNEIIQENDDKVKCFFLCAFSNILKGCSIWLQKSNKPTRDLKKIPYPPIKSFIKQVKAMMRGNAALHKLTNNQSEINVFCADARQVPLQDGTVDLIVTSPPYVTSYEYADLHQLSALWFAHTDNLTEFRKRFIGTSSYVKKDIETTGEIAANIINQLMTKHSRTANEVAMYFDDMYQVFHEVKRILKTGGKFCMVIGNTKIKDVEILNAEVFTKQLETLGLKLIDVIKREIPSKNLPSIRDAQTGQFTKVTSSNQVTAYPTEYILTFQK